MTRQKKASGKRQKGISYKERGDKYTKGNKISRVKWTRIPVADPQNGRSVSVHQYFPITLAIKYYGKSLSTNILSLSLACSNLKSVCLNPFSSSRRA